jgi:hypothetical protein
VQAASGVCGVSDVPRLPLTRLAPLLQGRGGVDIFLSNNQMNKYDLKI